MTDSWSARCRSWGTVSGAVWSRGGTAVMMGTLRRWWGGYQTRTSQAGEVVTVRWDGAAGCELAGLAAVVGLVPPDWVVAGQRVGVGVVGGGTVPYGQNRGYPPGQPAGTQH